MLVLVSPTSPVGLSAALLAQLPLGAITKVIRANAPFSVRLAASSAPISATRAAAGGAPAEDLPAAAFLVLEEAACESAANSTINSKLRALAASAPCAALFLRLESGGAAGCAGIARACAAAAAAALPVLPAPVDAHALASAMLSLRAAAAPARAAAVREIYSANTTPAREAAASLLAAAGVAPGGGARLDMALDGARSLAALAERLVAAAGARSPHSAMAAAGATLVVTAVEATAAADFIGARSLAIAVKLAKREI